MSLSGESLAACRISSEYAFPIPLNRRGSVSERLSVAISTSQGLPELFQRCRERLDTTAIDGFERSGAVDNVHEARFFEPRFGEEQTASVEFEFGQHHSWGHACFLARRAPAEPARNHEVQDEIELVIEGNHDPLAESTDAAHNAAVQRIERRVHGAKDEWAFRESPLQHQAGDARIQRVDEQNDVGQFGHGPLWRESCSQGVRGRGKAARLAVSSN